MDKALTASRKLTVPTLILYGEKDEIIPAPATCRLLASLPPAPPGRWRLVQYPAGYHMLTRDLQGQAVLADMQAWLHDPAGALPSGHQIERAQALSEFCGDRRP
jgi:alpha-beta hydrolase superfamily lysophospholipase